MPLSRLEHLRHMLDEADYLIAQKQGLDKERFLKDATLNGPLCGVLKLSEKPRRKFPPI